MKIFTMMVTVVALFAFSSAASFGEAERDAESQLRVNVEEERAVDKNRNLSFLEADSEYTDKKIAKIDQKIEELKSAVKELDERLIRLEKESETKRRRAQGEENSLVQALNE